MARPALLFLSQALPYPPDGGVKIRTYHVLRQLAGAFDVTALCFYRAKAGVPSQSVDDAVKALGAFGHVEAFSIPQEQSRARLLFDHGRSALTRRVYTAFAYRSAPFSRRLQTLLAERSFDLVHADSLDLAWYFPRLSDLPLVCVHHDAQSTLLRRRAQRERSLWRRSYLGLQSRLMEDEERRWCPLVSLNVAVSEVDRETLLKASPSSRFAVVPNGVDLSYFTVPTDAIQEGVVFVGGSTWFPNADGMRYFCDAILPVIRGGGEQPQVVWVGRASEAERREYAAAHGIEVTGYVDDVRPYIARAACYVVPLRVGGGTRIKILDAWAMGKAIVSTTVGCEGLAAIDGHNILIRDDPREFAAAAVAVLRDHGLRQRLGREGRQTVERLYSWESIGRRMIDDYQALLPRRAPARLESAQRTTP